jgi:hypothetical protein
MNESLEVRVSQDLHHCWSIGFQNFSTRGYNFGKWQEHCSTLINASWLVALEWQCTNLWTCNSLIILCVSLHLESQTRSTTCRTLPHTWSSCVHYFTRVCNYFKEWWCQEHFVCFRPHSCQESNVQYSKC